MERAVELAEEDLPSALVEQARRGRRRDRDDAGVRGHGGDLVVRQRHCAGRHAVDRRRAPLRRADGRAGRRTVGTGQHRHGDVAARVADDLVGSGVGRDRPDAGPGGGAGELCVGAVHEVGVLRLVPDDPHAAGVERVIPAPLDRAVEVDHRELLAARRRGRRESERGQQRGEQDAHAPIVRGALRRETSATVADLRDRSHLGRPQRRADSARVRPELGGDDRDVVDRGDAGAAADLRTDRAEQELAGVGDAAADDDALGPQQDDRVRDRARRELARARECGDRGLVAGAAAVGGRLTVALPGGRGDRLARSPSELEAAAVAAAAAAGRRARPCGARSRPRGRARGAGGRRSPRRRRRRCRARCRRRSGRRAPAPRRSFGQREARARR